MTESPEEPVVTEALPAARIRRRRWGFSVVWVVPVVAAIVAGYLVYGRVQELGPTITIKFKDGAGVKAGQTEIRYRGVPIGEVREIELSEGGEYVAVNARLRRSAATIAREGSVFWIVRPEVGPGTISGLSTVFTGPYIQVLPGSGKPRLEFTGLERPPPALERAGLKIILATANLGSVRSGSPVYYRGIEVGSITDTELSRDATSAHVHLFIRQRFARLVRLGSRFWIVSGLDVNVSLLKGVEINLESLRSLVTGGIAFATPEGPNPPPAKDGMIFVLHDKPEKEWLEWAPKIPIPPGS
jgi:paraquat-inducible protein B